MYLGGLFDGADHSQEVAFRYAIERVNGNRHVLPRSKLTPISERLTPNDSFAASKKVCQMLRVGVASILGPGSAISGDHVSAVCQVFFERIGLTQL